ncbi:unnamed protein product [Psylliodes chrysocephalus]|uniref:Uncharacterized protein n=1 Tax=Psylliodes chrysocephalus TaxID=3402493 RepID=A0A9P0D2B6_9CUCU|nr:unnamed protein product [Psylliodes chrysocephala]
MNFLQHQWYYQIQGQLHITGRKGCIFGVWTDHKHPLKVEYILKRHDFWQNKMEQKLKSFFMNCILPELVDPRHVRGMPLREPAYILEAIKNKKQNKKELKIKQN